MQKFDTPTPISAVLNIPAGRVRLIAADRADTTVDVRPADAAKGRDVRAAERTTVDYRDGVLRIQAPEAKNELFGPSGSLEVTVQLPAGSHVEAKAAAAEFRGVGRLGDVAIDGAHGQVKLDEAASARLNILAGDALVGRLDGPADITSGKGDLRITEAARGTVTLHTGYGEISVGAAPDASASLDAGTSHGRIHNSLRNSGDGGARLDIHATTGYGDITARSL
ncbi:DUF4097 family beta strand repeat-containing protein [Streptomyces sp. MB09-02B]|uniref:DUF4097 family beta strand repeat-containing protein n=1 Tax=Streptomyces sp. MB09-02B TaxID=3028667 RepID=UPI0029AFCC3A|nr:DUF4097 family beta strand repeat-containing protein [Streptomyces sp. MB09-02B]MDX3643964.1 DUF4097 family beta strand repeat-containing protein [Streptomyces sp. MB09-02B]